MPVEETANILIMLAAIAQRSSNSTAFIATKYWPLLKSWGDYLVTTALDPGNQLCTDDFEGPSPHNANLVSIIACINICIQYKFVGKQYICLSSVVVYFFVLFIYIASTQFIIHYFRHLKALLGWEPWLSC